MKCPSCGAETKSAEFCEYCDSELPKTTPNINITNNYYGISDNSTTNTLVGKCPKCSSTNIKFHREKISSTSTSHSRKTIFANIRKSNSIRQNIYRTVGVCQICGYTWEPNSSTTNSKSWKSSSCLWWLFMLCIWPITLSFLFYKTDKIKLDKKWKITIIALFWILILLFSGSSEDDTNPHSSDTNIESALEETGINDKLYAIDTFIEKYNAISTRPIADAIEIDIHDKESSNYRTEYRLAAFNDAKAKRGFIGEDMIDIVCTGKTSDEFNIRIYFNTSNRDIAEDVFHSIALNVYPNLTETELLEANAKIHQKDSMDGRGFLRDINYYYIDSYGELFMDNVMYAK